MNETVFSLIGNTRLVKLNKIPGPENRERNNIILGKMEGDNPSGSVKDRAALGMILGAESRGEIRPGDTLIEATSGNTGISLAMMAAVKGYNLKLVMPESMGAERKHAMEAYGAEVILVPSTSTSAARDHADELVRQGHGVMLDQFSNDDNWKMHYNTTGPEIWSDTKGKVTHFVSAMGTKGTITGVSRFLKERDTNIKMIGVQPDEESERIYGIARWQPGYEPSIGQHAMIDQIFDANWEDAKVYARRLAQREGIFCGFSAAAACWAALEVAKTVENAVIVFVVCDRGDRYLSTGIYGRKLGATRPKQH